jgi:hypothetical protein
MGNLGIECSNICKNNEADIENNYNFEPNNTNQNQQLKNKKYMDIQKNQKRFNEIFKKKLPNFGKEINENEFNSNIPENIRTYITENIFDYSQFLTPNKNTYEARPIEFKNGNIYNGNWNENIQMDGYGKLILKNENVLAEGVWDEGILKEGRIFLSNGDIYEGEIKNSTFNGKGKLIGKDGTFYEGEFKNGFKNGYGKIIYPDNSVYMGNFNEDNLDGKGEFEWKDGFLYKGIFRKNKLSGKGQITNKKSGSNYEGEFNNNYFEGKGKFNFKSGSFYEGEFKVNKRDGKGTYFDYKKNLKYIGDWLEDKQHGFGKIEDGNYVIKCTWRNGQTVETPQIESGEEIDKKYLNNITNFVPEDIDIIPENLPYIEQNNNRFGFFKPDHQISQLSEIE